MSPLGQSRRFSHVRDMSASPPTAVDLVRCSETTRRANSGSQSKSNLATDAVDADGHPVGHASRHGQLLMRGRANSRFLAPAHTAELRSSPHDNKWRNTHCTL